MAGVSWDSYRALERKCQLLRDIVNLVESAGLLTDRIDDDSETAETKEHIRDLMDRIED